MQMQKAHFAFLLKKIEFSGFYFLTVKSTTYCSDIVYSLLLVDLLKDIRTFNAMRKFFLNAKTNWFLAIVVLGPFINDP